MAHYNLYDSLKLDNNASSDDIVALLEKRIQEGELDNLGGLEEVNLAKKILGNPEKRAKYDARLQDPTAPDITVDSIRDLAATANAQGAGAPRNPGLNSPTSSEKLSAVKSTFNSAAAGASDRARSVQAEYQKSSRTAIALTAVAALVAGGVIVGVVGSMLGGGSSSSGGADEKGIAYGGTGYKESDYEGAENFANSFLNLRDEEETRDWIIKNTNARDRSSMLEELKIGDGSAYTGMDAYFGNNELVAGKPFSFTGMFRPLVQSVDAYAEEFGDQDTRDEIVEDITSDIFDADGEELEFFLGLDGEYFIVPVIGDGEWGEGELIVRKDGENWVLIDFSLDSTFF